MSLLCRKNIASQILMQLRTECIRYSLFMNVIFLSHFMSFSIYYITYLPTFIRRFGPAYTFWMYSFERFNSWIRRRIHVRCFPETTVVEIYCLFEFTVSVYLKTASCGVYFEYILDISVNMNSQSLMFNYVIHRRPH